jgi:hypothetical protein
MKDPYYDLNDDWSVIYSSFRSQYGIRLATQLDDMSWREFSAYLSGLSGDTPLGRLISVRAEKDPEKLKQFTPDMKRIRTEWARKQALKKPQNEVDQALDGFKQAFIRMAQ